MQGTIGTFLALRARSRASSFRRLIRCTSTKMARSINSLSTCVPSRRPRSLRKSSCKDFSLRGRRGLRRRSGEGAGSLYRHAGRAQLRQADRPSGRLAPRRRGTSRERNCLWMAVLHKCRPLIAETAREEFMLRIAIIIVSTRPGRKGEAVAKWVYEIAQKRSDAEFELVDIKEFNLPLLDEPVSPIMGQYSHQHTKTWSAKIASFDAYVFVTPEYNHGTSGALKNAIDFLYHEWVNKAAGFVSYGGAGGARAVEQLRLVMAEVQIATVRNQVLLSMFTDFENFSAFKPSSHHEKSVDAMLYQVIA